MTTTMCRRIRCVMAAALTGLITTMGAAPALAAPKAEDGGSAQVERGKSQSDPDGEKNGGADKPDGNNGSGNDTDCEDDNNGRGTPGHCQGEPAKPAEPAKPETPAAGPQDEQVTENGEPTTPQTENTNENDNRGKSTSDPDGDRNGGPDKPGGAHRDGNNGSGNDTDCEDDNNGRGTPGHCQGEPAASGDDDSAEPGQGVEEPQVLDIDDERPTYVADPPWPAPREQARPELLGQEKSVEKQEQAAVLGISAQRSGVMAAATGVLPNTGAGAVLLSMVVLGGLSAAAGLLLIRIRRATA